MGKVIQHGNLACKLRGFWSLLRGRAGFSTPGVGPTGVREGASSGQGVYSATDSDSRESIGMDTTHPKSLNILSHIVASEKRKGTSVSILNRLRVIAVGFRPEALLE